MLQEVIYYIVTMILTKELVIATDQCIEYQFKSPFFPGVSCEDIYNKNPESHDWPGYYWIHVDGPSDVYCGMNYTGSSCEDIYNNNPETGDKSGGWRRIVNINISAGDDCSGEWRKATQSGVSFYRVASDDNFKCSSASFSTNGISYQRMCGRARGYQKGDTAAFYGSDPYYNNRTIDQDYVSGLSITYSSNPRQHIWTFASSRGERYDNEHNCPCKDTQTQVFNSPTYVGNNYYCESASWYESDFDTYHFNDTLWDGVGCIDNCCDDTTQP